MKKKELGNRIIFIVALIVFLVAAAKLIGYGWNYLAAAKQYDKLADTYVQTDDTDEDDESLKGGSQDANTEQDEWDGSKYCVDFDALLEANPDTVGWIRIDGLDVSYPIMQGTDNDYYLTHTFEGDTLTAASIFMDYSNTPDFTDQNTFIYGHNMKNKSMFGKLNQYAEEEFYKKNPYFYIYTPEHTYRYEIFSCYLADVSGDADSFYINFADTEDFESYIDSVKARSEYDTGVTVTSDDKIVTLMTCNSAGHEYRYLIHAKQEVVK